jgi:tetraacyldisaccharide 4'-kinase
VNSPFLMVLKAREKLYKAGIFRTRRLSYPVISIGNLTLGGTGKTPLVMFLAERMRNEGFRPVILSRGYHRTTRGVLVVSRGSGPLMDWKEAGDEPYLMACRLAGTPLVVGENRYEAGLHAESEGLGNLFILDDGFQHRQLYRDVDIITIDPREWIAGETLLPMGRWREPQTAIHRAHAACVQDVRDADVQLPIPTFKVSFRIDGIFRCGEFGLIGSAVSLSELRGRAVVAFAGIAKPERFFSALESMGLNLLQRLSFPDHYVFSEAELKAIEGAIGITTEKDAVRLTHKKEFLALRVSAEVPEFEALRALILGRLTKSK